MDPQKLIKSVSETPLEEWKKEHFMRFVNNPRVNLASLSQIISISFIP